MTARLAARDRDAVMMREAHERGLSAVARDAEAARLAELDQVRAQMEARIAQNEDETRKAHDEELAEMHLAL